MKVFLCLLIALLEHMPLESVYICFCFTSKSIYKVLINKLLYLYWISLQCSLFCLCHITTMLFQ